MLAFSPMKFRYFKFPLGTRSKFFGSSILKPIIPIEIIYGNKAINYTALIDSGADFCIFDAEIGEYLGIDVRSGIREDFGGIQEKGGAQSFLHEIILVIGGLRYRTMVGFSYDIAKHGFAILGQRGFFELFSVKFDFTKEEIELKEQKR